MNFPSDLETCIRSHRMHTKLCKGYEQIEYKQQNVI